MIVLLILIPALAGAAAFFIASDPLRRGLLVSTAIVQFALSVGTWMTPPPPALGGWLAEDALGRLFLTLTSLLFLASSFYAVAYLREERGQRHSDSEEGFLFSNAREASFTGCLLLFLAAMTLVTLSQQLALLWVAVEATTLASAPLIYFHRHHRSLEATWKYLLICSVGIALALLGIFFLAVAATSPGSCHGLPGSEGPALRRAALESAVAQSGVRADAGRLRHQDGARAISHLAARRPQ